MRAIFNGGCTTTRLRKGGVRQPVDEQIFVQVKHVLLCLGEHDVAVADLHTAVVRLVARRLHLAIASWINGVGVKSSIEPDVEFEPIVELGPFRAFSDVEDGVLEHQRGLFGIVAAAHRLRQGIHVDREHLIRLRHLGDVEHLPSGNRKCREARRCLDHLGGDAEDLAHRKHVRVEQMRVIDFG